MAHRSTLLPVVALAFTALSLAPRVHAAGEAGEKPGQPMLFGHPVNVPPELTPDELEARAKAFHEGLERQGLVLKGTQVLPKSALVPKIRDETHPVEAWDLPPHRTSIFLNFFGGKLTNGTNASEAESPCVQGTVDYPGYLEGEAPALAIIQVFKNAAEPFGMRILYEKVPPKHLPYSQVMMGGRPGVIGLPQGVLGVSCNLDCGDTWWRDTTFAFTEETNQIAILGTTALQEAAHSFGLDHIDGANNIMYPYATPGDKVWASTCTPYNDATGGIGCTHIHDKFCDGGAQNDVAELTAYFGLNSVDSEAPTVNMLSPMDGQMYTKGDTLHIEVEVDDNFLGYGWRLMVPELNQEQPVYNGQTVWDLPVPPKGEYTIRVEALDHDGNIGFAEAKIYVDTVPSEGGDSTGDTPTTGGGDTSASGSGSDPSAGESGGSGSEGSDTSAIDSKDDGCSCRSDAPAPGPTWLLGLAGALLLRRRRR
jgi:MYXO-CTERM domain-containing protein